MKLSRETTAQNRSCKKMWQRPLTLRSVTLKGVTLKTIKVKGMTLIEVMIVLLMLGLLAGITVNVYRTSFENTEDRTLISAMRELGRTSVSNAIVNGKSQVDSIEMKQAVEIQQTWERTEDFAPDTTPQEGVLHIFEVDGRLVYVSRSRDLSLVGVGVVDGQSIEVKLLNLQNWGGETEHLTNVNWSEVADRVLPVLPVE